LAANQGLYNGFLAAGIVFSIIQNNISIALFFIVCVIVAGVFGAYSTKQIKLFYIQAIPAIIVLIYIIVNNI
jgi:putative membrane protein